MRNIDPLGILRVKVCRVVCCVQTKCLKRSCVKIAVKFAHVNEHSVCVLYCLRVLREKSSEASSENLSIHKSETFLELKKSYMALMPRKGCIPVLF